MPVLEDELSELSLPSSEEELAPEGSETSCGSSPYTYAMVITQDKPKKKGYIRNRENLNPGTQHTNFSHHRTKVVRSRHMRPFGRTAEDANEPPE